MGEDLIVSAADLEKFGYCPLSWWLSRDMAAEEEALPELRKGEEKHAAVAGDVAHIRDLEHRARQAETVVLYYSVAATFVAVLGLTVLWRASLTIGEILSVVSLIWLLAAVYYLYKAETLATPEERMLSERVMLSFAMVAAVVAVLNVSLVYIDDVVLATVVEVSALVWLIGATFFLERAVRHLAEAREKRQEHKMREGEIAYVDRPSERPKMYESKRLGLRGRPDYVLIVGESQVPVEVKTGRTPRGPLFSHILQLAAYCLLIEEETGKAPPYGLLKYEGAQHEIEYNAEMRQLVVQKLDELRGAWRRQEAHRNHNRPGKCVHCSRRAVCPERLA